ncbi:MAG: hypothetical protein CMQ15_17375 [Gammaproteobacteria bacterium]|jgi:hypothetical protein|nr:hypothetical protein [Gammaproteobacteria bacterium]
MNKNSPLNQCYICSIGADGVQFVLILTGKTAVSLNTTMRVAELISAIAGTSIHVGSSEQCVRIEIL